MLPSLSHGLQRPQPRPRVGVRTLCDRAEEVILKRPLLLDFSRDCVVILMAWGVAIGLRS